MSRRKGEIKHDMSGLKALVAIYGPREAARRANVPEGTMLYYASRHKWKKATGFRDEKERPKDGGDVVSEVLIRSREESTINLAEYTRKASKKAAEHKDPLEVARKVRDVAGVYQVLFPAEEGNELIEGSILIGEAAVTDNPEEIMARAKEVSDVRQELPGERSAGD